MTKQIYVTTLLVGRESRVKKRRKENGRETETGSNLAIA